MRILGIETSCDETAAAVVEDGHKLLSNVVASSVDLHAAFGGVVPEIAARSHLEVIIPVIEEALRQAFLPNAQNGERRKEKGDSVLPTPYSMLHTSQSDDLWSQIDAIAVTQGPGLLGSLLIGVLTARTLAIAKQKPLFAINHVHAHVYACFITEASEMSKSEFLISKQNLNAKYELPKSAPKFPILALIVSGGHTQLVLFESHKKYKMLGQTTDDAVGEAYDKVAKMLGLPYPGGPSVAKLAKRGSANAFILPKAKTTNPYDFSFSGLKTAVLRAAQNASGHDYTFPSSALPAALKKAQKANLAASFQRKIIETLLEVTQKAEVEFQPKTIVIAGGVAANQELRKQTFKQLSTPIIYPDIKLCTDNAAMVATLGYFKAKYNQPTADPYSLEAAPGLSM